MFTRTGSAGMVAYGLACVDPNQIAYRNTLYQIPHARTMRS